jgi:arsenical pump membrane protein
MTEEIAAVALLAVVLAAAVRRPHGLPEAFAAVPAAVILLLVGVVSPRDVGDELHQLLPVLLFLAAVLVLAHVCAAEGLFEAAGQWLSRTSGQSGKRLLLNVFVLSAAVTSVLSLDATVVLLTPVVLATVTRMRVPARPHVYAAGHLANSASLLLPMGNLTNLLAIAASGLSLVRFAGLMVVPFAAVLLTEYVVLRLVFGHELREPATPDRDNPMPFPKAAVWVLSGTLVAFVITSFLGVAAYWAAIAGAVVLVTHALKQRLCRPVEVAKAVDVPFLLFVCGLAVVVRGVVDHGLGGWVARVAPSSEGLLALLAFAAMGALLANIVNNLPALLILLAPAAEVGPTAVLAVLIGVNIGPNLTFTGSLATLLWRRVLAEHGLSPSLARFTVLGLLTVPVGVVLATCGLWASAAVLSVR